MDTVGLIIATAAGGVLCWLLLPRRSSTREFRGRPHSRQPTATAALPEGDDDDG